MADLFAMLQAAAGNAGEDVDPDFANTVLLLHGDGTNGAQNNTFLDSSTNNFTITRNGNTTQGSFTPFSKPDGRWGNSFLGDTDYITCTSNAAYQLNTGDFTIECWLYTTALVGNVGKVFQYATDGNFSGGGYGFSNETNVNTLTWGRSTGTVTLTSSAPTNEWFHFAIVRSSGTLTAYLNGVSVFSAADSYNYNYGGAHPFAIGSGRNGAGNFTDDYTGYISNFRVVKGTAVYTGAFTPSTTPLTAIANTSLLTCQSNRFVDNSANAFAITAVGPPKVTPFSPFPITTEYSPAVNGGSMYSDGSGDYLSHSSPAASLREWWTTDWTIEAWVYPTSLATWGYSNESVLVGNGNAGNTTNYWSFGPFTDGTVKFKYFNGSSVTVTSTETVKANQWNHVAMIRNASGIKIFVNGIGNSYTAVSGTPQSSSGEPLLIGQMNNTSIQGYVNSLRIVYGSNVYTTDFTPPTAPLTAIANTSLLCNFTNAGIFDNTGFNNLETAGDVQLDSTIKKFGTASIEFDGANDALVYRATDHLAFGTGDYTVECWVYFNGIDPSTLQILFSSGDTGNAFFFHADANQLSVGTNSVFISNQATTFTTGVWYHVAACRSGTTLKLFQDGAQVGSDATDTTNWISTGLGRIGTNPAGTQPINGFIDDLRITKGVARYTTTFTPPTAAFPNIGA